MVRQVRPESARICISGQMTFKIRVDLTLGEKGKKCDALGTQVSYYKYSQT